MLTGIVLTYNEEKNIARCLENLKFCDTVLVVDGGSTDKTVSLAKKAGATILNHEFVDFSSQRKRDTTLPHNLSIANGCVLNR